MGWCLAKWNLRLNSFTVFTFLVEWVTPTHSQNGRFFTGIINRSLNVKELLQNTTLFDTVHSSVYSDTESLRSLFMHTYFTKIPRQDDIISHLQGTCFGMPNVLFVTDDHNHSRRRTSRDQPATGKPICVCLCACWLCVCSNQWETLHRSGTWWIFKTKVNISTGLDKLLCKTEGVIRVLM